MSNAPLRIVCGNPACKAGLLIQFPQKLKEAKCPACGYINPLTPANTAKPAAPPAPRPNLPAELGWLIVKDEQTRTQTFTLGLGRNTIGRRSDVAPAQHMIVTDDEYMSRRHCTVEVRVNRVGELDYLLQDGAALDGAGPDGSVLNGQWKNSLNGTYLNGREPGLGRHDKLYLADGDTIQIGTTKLVLKTCQLSQSLQEAYRTVEEMDYEHTIVSFK